MSLLARPPELDGAVQRGAPALSRRSRDWLTATGLGAVLAVLFLCTASYGPAQVNDTRAASVGAWSLGTRGSAVLPDDWPASRNYWGVEGPGPQGGVLVNRFPGVAYWAAPAYAVAAVVGGEPTPAHPFLVDSAPAAIAAALTAAAAAAVLFLLLREVMSREAALAAALVVATGTALWSVAADAMWPHGPAMLALAGMLLAWRRSHPLAAAACTTMAVLVRPHLVVVAAVLALFAWGRERPRDGAALAAGGALGLIGLSAYSVWAFGTWWPVAGYDAGAHLDGLFVNTPWQTVGDLGLALVSPTRGLLVFSPVVLAGLVALGLAWRRMPAWTLVSAAAGALYLVVQVRALGYRGGEDFFAYRVSLEPLLLAAPALVLAVVETCRRYRWVVPAVTLLGVLSIGIHSYGAVVGGMRAASAQSWEEIDAMVREQYAAGQSQER